MNQSERRRYLIQKLLNEQKEYSNYSIPEDSQGQKDLLRGLLNVRAPKVLSRDFLISGRVILLRFAVTRSSMRRTVE